MVCDGAFLASTIASILMNGVCCMWQMQEEEDRREAIRKDIRAEYNRQRFMDLERWAETRKLSQSYHSDSTSGEHDQRKKLVIRKMSISDSSMREAGEQDRDNVSVYSIASANAVLGGEYLPTTGVNVERTRSHSSPPNKRKSYKERRLGQVKAANISGSDMSSLLDSDDNEYDDGDSSDPSLVEVALQ